MGEGLVLADRRGRSKACGARGSCGVRMLGFEAHFDRPGWDRLGVILSSNSFNNYCLGWTGEHVRLTGVGNRRPISTARGGTGWARGSFG